MIAADIRERFRAPWPLAYRRFLEDTRTAETVKTKPGRVGTGVADDHMVEQLDVEGLGRLPELACDLNVCT